VLQEDLKRYRIILASASPRRQRLLKELELEFEVLSRDDLDEGYPPALAKDEIPGYLAEKKSYQYMPEVPGDTLLITADTIVWLNGHVIGKPADRQDAARILAVLSGSVHEVLTGVCLRSDTLKSVFTASSLVYFSELAGTEIDYYIERYRPYDKAGAYGIQEWIGYIGIERIEGSYFNVMGLPVQKLYGELKKFAGLKTKD
jgi:septum formation protein